MTHTWREELAQAAGFFNGEGCTVIRYKQARKDGSRYCYPAIYVGQAVTPETLLRLEKTLTLGIVSGPFRPYAMSKKPHWKFQIYGFEKVQAALVMMWSWLSTAKREQAMRVLSCVKESWK